jgi:hypothetical protein
MPEKIENAAGNSMFDFDIIEDNFRCLKKAEVILADYDLLRRDFTPALDGLTEEEIDEWLVENCAYLSEG